MELPDDIIEYIASKLDYPDMINFGVANKRIYNIIYPSHHHKESKYGNITSFKYKGDIICKILYSCSTCVFKYAKDINNGKSIEDKYVNNIHNLRYVCNMSNGKLISTLLIKYSTKVISISFTDRVYFCYSDHNKIYELYELYMSDGNLIEYLESNNIPKKMMNDMLINKLSNFIRRYKCIMEEI